MKKFISIALVIAMVLSMTACGKKENTSTGNAKEVGIWSISDVNLDVDAMKETYEAEGMEWTELSNEEIQEYTDFYKMFMGSLYMEFKDDGTGTLDFYVPEDEKYEGYVEGESASAFKWADGKITYTDEGMEDVEALNYIINGDNLEISEEGMILTFSKISSLEEIENTEFWKSIEALQESVNSNMEPEEDSEIIAKEDVVDEATEETTENSNND